MKKKGIIALVIFVMFGVFTIVQLTSNKKEIEQAKEIVDRSHIPIAVNVFTAKVMEMNSVITRPSVIQPNEMATVAASMPGKLERLDVELGTKVTKGQVIGKVDTKIQDIQLKNLELTVAKFERDYKRNKELYEGKALSESQFLDSKFAYESRQLELEQLRQQISDSYIKSPISGTITDKRNLSGEFIGAGNPVAIVLDVNTLKAYVSVNESEVRYIRTGQMVKVLSSIHTDKEFKGKVTYVSPSSDENFNYKIEVQINVKDNPELRAGAYVHVYFEADQNTNALQIPKKALVEGVKNAFVYVQEGDKAVKRFVKVGRENDAFIEIIDGLSENEKVVVEGQINIVDNSLIQSKDTK